MPELNRGGEADVLEGSFPRFHEAIGLGSWGSCGGRPAWTRTRNNPVMSRGL